MGCPDFKNITPPHGARNNPIELFADLLSAPGGNTHVRILPSGLTQENGLAVMRLRKSQ